MTKTRNVITSAVVLAVLSGCSGATETPDAAPAAVDTPSSSAAATPSAAASPAAAAAPLKLGKSLATPDGAATVTALAYEQPVAGDVVSQAPDGHEWGALQVKACVSAGWTSTEIYLSEAPWQLLYSDGATYEPSSAKYRSFPEPGYPAVADRPTASGKCTSGWITFPVAKGKKPATASYAGDGLPTPAEWVIS